jgi:hypothetical protein
MAGQHECPIFGLEYRRSTVAKLYKLLSTTDRAAESTKGKRDTTEGAKKCEEKKVQ